MEEVEGTLNLGDAHVSKQAGWMAALVVTMMLILPACATADGTYGDPEGRPLYFLRPYSQRSFRLYYAHRVAEHFRRPNLESYPTISVDVTPSYNVIKFPCPTVFPSEYYRIPGARYDTSQIRDTLNK
jgi:hypothetical protein